MMSPVQTAVSPLACAATEGSLSRNGMKKLNEMLPTMIAVVCAPAESQTRPTASSAQ